MDKFHILIIIFVFIIRNNFRNDIRNKYLQEMKEFRKELRKEMIEFIKDIKNVIKDIKNEIKDIKNNMSYLNQRLYYFENWGFLTYESIKINSLILFSYNDENPVIFSDVYTLCQGSLIKFRNKIVYFTALHCIYRNNIGIKALVISFKQLDNTQLNDFQYKKYTCYFTILNSDVVSCILEDEDLSKKLKLIYLISNFKSDFKVPKIGVENGRVCLHTNYKAFSFRKYTCILNTDIIRRHLNISFNKEKKDMNKLFLYF